MAHYSNPQQLELVYVNHYYTCGCEVRRIAEDAAQPDQLEDFLRVPLGDTLYDSCLINEHSYGGRDS
jgi:hypothetical protein